MDRYTNRYSLDAHVDLDADDGEEFDLGFGDRLFLGVATFIFIHHAWLRYMGQDTIVVASVIGLVWESPSRGVNRRGMLALPGRVGFDKRNPLQSHGCNESSFHRGFSITIIGGMTPTRTSTLWRRCSLFLSETVPS